ncbi:MAG: FadR/GntR family transcriptional regulator [Azospirillaceae bacterium]
MLRNIQPSRRSGKADTVARTIMAWITDGDLAPGEKLPGERHLAETLGVSRVSVRAALQQLKARGLLSAVQGGGTRVAATAARLDDGLSTLARARIENLRDLAEIRMAVESWAARRAAERATPDQVAAIRNHLERMIAAGDGRDSGRQKAREDAAFHLAIGKAAGSAVYVHFLATIRDVLADMLDFHRYRLFKPADDAIVAAHHQAIYQAIAEHAPEAAERAMRDHLQWVLDYYDRDQPRS